MKSKINKYLILFLISLCMVIISGCAKYRDIKVVSYKVTSLRLKGFKSADIVVDAQIQNPVREFDITDISGQVFYKGLLVANYTCNPFIVKAKCVDFYTVKGEVQIDDNIPVFKIISEIKDGGVKKGDLYTNYRFRIKFKHGFSKWIHYNNVLLNNDDINK